MTEVRPIVARRTKDRTPLYFAIGMALAAVLLFLSLNSRRQALEAPSERGPVGAAPSASPEAIPDLVLPVPADRPPVLLPTPPKMASPAQIVTARPAPQPRIIVQAPAAPPPAYSYAAPPYPITETTPLVAPSAEASVAVADTAAKVTGRISASRLANPADTVPQGTLISAVLETALDSTGAGQARALVTRNIFGFDGSKLLIPRGSRLYGSYQAGVDQGQRRALIRWTRLIHPDGITIALDSAASDPLGRAGVKGKVDSHFLARLGNALLSSTVGLGDALLSRRLPPVVVVPGGQAGNQAASQLSQQSSPIRPTLHVKPGARVSVFVEHDLDFSSVDDAP